MMLFERGVPGANSGSRKKGVEIKIKNKKEEL